ncbi:hypothetical protein PY67_06300 [Lacticaseibacillus rhamnosus]|nr:hypothetical protein PY67_06300 [Lacticaseibacillus rhamnosus]
MRLWAGTFPQPLTGMKPIAIFFTLFASRALHHLTLVTLDAPSPLITALPTDLYRRTGDASEARV